MGQKEVEEIDRDRVGKREEKERQKLRYCWYLETQIELVFRSDEV